MVWLTGSILWLLVAGFPVKPPDGEYCTDHASLIDPADRDRINAVSRALIKEFGVPIHVVTVRSLASHGAEREGIESFARRLFDHWGIGSARHNYGILLLIAKVDRKARIEFGASWAHERDDAAHRIMQDLILPAFRDEKFSTGIVLGVDGLDSMARGKPLPNYRKKSGSMIIWVVAAVVVIFLVVIVKVQVDPKPWRRRVRERTGSRWRALVAKRAARDLLQGYGSDFWSSGGGGFWGGGGGGGFSGGGGGGSSGGGGATGSW